MTFEQIKKNIAYGDYNLLQKLLQAPTVQAARMRFLRDKDPKAMEAMVAIQQNRAEFIKEFQTQTETGKVDSVENFQP